VCFVRGAHQGVGDVGLGEGTADDELAEGDRCRVQGGVVTAAITALTPLVTMPDCAPGASGTGG
jgi:hypothetical protein